MTQSTKPNSPLRQRMLEAAILIMTYFVNTDNR